LDFPDFLEIFMNKAVKLLVSAGLISTLGIGTYAQKTMNEDFRKTAPAALAPKPFEIAKPFETTLPNGLKGSCF
jgi:hypothetical protein